MKKFALISILALALLLAACGGAAPAAQQPSAEPQQNESETVVVEAAEDGQNPVMNFVGTYAAGRPSILVECEGTEDARFTVMWSSSAAENSEWIMSGKLDTGSLTVDYNNCVRTDRVYHEDGSVASETVVYENGRGRVTFLADQNALTWADEQEHMADDLIFTFAVDMEDPAFYSGVTAMDKAAVEAIAGDVRRAYLEEDWASLAELIRYPIIVDGTELQDPESFLSFMSGKTVHESDRLVMEEESCWNMFFNGQGICMGSGQVWLLDPNYMTDVEPVIQIIALSGIVDK